MPMPDSTKPNPRPQTKLPRLLALGPIVIKKAADLRRFLLIYRAYNSGAVSLRRAHQLCVQNAAHWGVEALVDTWEMWRSAAFATESLLSQYFGTDIPLFVRPGEGLPWTGLTPQADQARELCEEFLAWHDDPDSFRDVG